jgi:hypothetical protein
MIIKIHTPRRDTNLVKNHAQEGNDAIGSLLFIVMI